MTLPSFDYAAGKSLKQACLLLKKHRGRAVGIAGGTDLLQARKNRLNEPELVVDLGCLPRLNEITFTRRSGLRIGALATLRQLANDPVVSSNYPILVQAATAVGSPQLQAMGTVGGNLCQDTLCLYYNRSPMQRLSLMPCHKLGGNVCHAVSSSKECWAVYSGDLAPALYALSASVVIADLTGKRELPLDKIYSGDGKRPINLKPGQIVTEVRVPAPRAQAGGIYLKLRQRKTIDYPLLGVACYIRMKDGLCADANLTLTGIERSPLSIPESHRLEGKTIGTEDIEELAVAAFKRARPLANVCELSPKYRREMVKVYVRNAVTHAIAQAETAGTR